eukprot:484545-Prorocentrum_minimum.AAC.1
MQDPDPKDTAVLDLRRYHTKYTEPTASVSAVQHTTVGRMPPRLLSNYDGSRKEDASITLAHNYTNDRIYAASWVHAVRN